MKKINENEISKYKVERYAFDIFCTKEEWLWSSKKIEKDETKQKHRKINGMNWFSFISSSFVSWCILINMNKRAVKAKYR